MPPLEGQDQKARWYWHGEVSVTGAGRIRRAQEGSRSRARPTNTASSESGTTASSWSTPVTAPEAHDGPKNEPDDVARAAVQALLADEVEVLAYESTRAVKDMLGGDPRSFVSLRE